MKLISDITYQIQSTDSRRKHMVVHFDHLKPELQERKPVHHEHKDQQEESNAQSTTYPCPVTQTLELYEDNDKQILSFSNEMSHSTVHLKGLPFL